MKERGTSVVGVIAHSVDIKEAISPTEIRDFPVGVMLFDRDLIKQRFSSPFPQGQWVNTRRCLSDPNLPVESPQCATYAQQFATWIDRIY